jgi:hypothetical protein
MNNQLQHRLSNLEVDPTTGMWDAITDALEDQTSATAGKLQHFEAAPKAHLWQQIEKDLDTDSETQTHKIPAYKRLEQPLRYGGAVAILVLVAATIVFLLNKETTPGKFAQQPTITLPSQKQPHSGKATDPLSNSSKASPSAASGKASVSNNNEHTPGDEAEDEKGSAQRSTSSRYLTVATEEGTPIRLSKKVFPVFDCAEHSTAIKRHQCKENIEALQKMASSLASPSGDFASLMDMIKTLEENR